jgi:hypothetical protein
MKTLAKLIAATVAADLLTGCIVVPTGAGYGYGDRHGH